MSKEPEGPQPEFDKGGVLPPGTGPVANLRKDEYILTATQWSTIRRLFEGDDEE